MGVETEVFAYIALIIMFSAATALAGTMKILNKTVLFRVVSFFLMLKFSTLGAWATYGFLTRYYGLNWNASVLFSLVACSVLFEIGLLVSRNRWLREVLA